VLIVGLLLLLLGYLTGVGILQTLGIILLVVGAVLWKRWAARLAAVGTTGSPLGAPPTDPMTMPDDFASMSGHVQARTDPGCSLLTMDAYCET